MTFGVLEILKKLFMKEKEMVLFKKIFLICPQIIFQLFTEKFLSKIKLNINKYKKPFFNRLI